MPDLPSRFAALIITFAPLLVQRSWLHARVLLVGAILAPGRRTVARSTYSSRGICGPDIAPPLAAPIRLHGAMPLATSVVNLNLAEGSSCHR